MQCNRCKFENMPGLTTCMRCGSVLGGAEGPVDIEPPRMAAWKGPIRGFFRGLRQAGLLRAIPFEKVQQSLAGPFASVLGVVFSILPGLGHFLLGRLKKKVWLLLLAWLVLFCLGLFFFGGQFGMACIGLSIGLHAWIGIHSGYLRKQRLFRERATAFLFALIFYLFVYYGGRQMLSRVINLGFSRVAIPAQHISLGDVFLGVPYDPNDHPISRGMLVSTELYRYHPRGWFLNQETSGGSAGYVQVVGLPGEVVQIQDRTFYINDGLLDPNEFPVPAWLRSRTFAVTVPEKHYFISAAYRGTGYNTGMITQACLISEDQVRARAIMQWSPIRRRKFLRMHE